MNKIVIVALMAVLPLAGYGFDNQALYLPGRGKIVVTLDSPLTSAAMRQGGLFVDDKGMILVKAYPAGTFSSPDPTRFEVLAPALDPAKSYVLKLYPVAEGDVFLDLGIVRIITGALGASNNCPNAVMVTLKAAGATQTEIDSAMDILLGQPESTRHKSGERHLETEIWQAADHRLYPHTTPPAIGASQG